MEVQAARAGQLDKEWKECVLIMQNKKTEKQINFVDLFAGCGGLSEGFYAQGYNALAHVEINSAACKTLVTRMKHYGYHDADKAVLEIDITREDILEVLDQTVGGKEVDVIIGGPPCQSFSSLGRAKDENGMKFDPRNYLFKSYVKVLNHYKPRFFVFENVTGLLTATLNGSHIVNTIIDELSENYNVALRILNSANYGVPQVRKRVIIIGVRKDLSISPNEVHDSIIKTHYDPEMPESARTGLKKYVTVRDAISELPAIDAGGGEKVMPFSFTKANEFLEYISKNATVLRDHVSRHNNDLDRKRYELMSKNNWTFQQLLENCPELRHPKQRVFGNSYAVQSWDYPSKTIIAHLYKDGNQFIHPDYKQRRTISVREAARLQSFPDDFVFEGARTDQFKQIGNAVPPLLAEAIAKAIKRFF